MTLLNQTKHTITVHIYANIYPTGRARTFTELSLQWDLFRYKKGSMKFYIIVISIVSVVIHSYRTDRTICLILNWKSWMIDWYITQYNLYIQRKSNNITVAASSFSTIKYGWTNLGASFLFMTFTFMTSLTLVFPSCTYMVTVNATLANTS